MIVYYHIEKTAGTTMLHWLERQCKTWHVKEWWTSRYWSIPYDTECVFSHCPFGEVEKHLDYGALGWVHLRHSTFLRHPVDRLISNYYHVLRNDRHSAHLGYLSYDITDLNKVYPTCDNGMVRLLAGRHDIGNLPIKKPVTRDDLERAKENLATFSFVGFQEHFDRDLRRFADKFFFDDLRYNWYRKGAYPRIDKDTRDVLAEQNKYDMELYEDAKRLSEESSS